MNYLEARYDRPLIPGARAALTPRQVGRIAWARRSLIVFIMALFAVLGVGMALFLPKTYQASVSLLIEFPSENPVTNQYLPADLAASYLATQIDLLKSEKVRLDVIEELNLGGDPEAREQFEANASPDASFDVWLATQMLSQINVGTGSGSRIIELGYSADDPSRAAEIANALVRAYMDTALELSLDPARRRRASYNDYLESLRKDVETAQANLTEAQQEMGVLDLEQAGGVDRRRLEDLNLRLNEVQSEHQAAQAKVARINELRQRGRPLTAQADILGSNYVQELKGRLLQLESSRADLAKTLGANHPRMQALDAEIGTVRSRLRAEISSYVEANHGEAQTAASRESALRDTLSTERQQVLDQQRKRDQIARHVRELDSAKSLYQAAVAQYDQVLGGSELQQSNVSVVSWATPPQFPEGLPGKILLALSIAAGGFIGVGLAMLIELLNRRVRSSDDVERELGLPVLGET